MRGGRFHACFSLMSLSSYSSSGRHQQRPAACYFLGNCWGRLTCSRLRLSVWPPMKCLHSTRLLRIVAALGLLLFAGDLSADAMADMMGNHCAPQTSQSAPDHDKSPCSHCSCAVHTGAVVVADSVMRAGAGAAPAVRLRGDKESDPTRLAGSIDHPPQLS